MHASEALHHGFWVISCVPHCSVRRYTCRVCDTVQPEFFGVCVGGVLALAMSAGLDDWPCHLIVPYFNGRVSSVQRLVLQQPSVQRLARIAM